MLTRKAPQASARVTLMGVRARRARRYGRPLAFAMIVPAAMLLVALILVPVGYSLVLSLFTWRITEINADKPFVGLDNYARLAQDPVLLTALRNTVVYVVGCVGVELVVGLAIAVALFRITRGRQLANALILLPMIIAPVITALLWRYVLDPQFGILAQLMSLAGQPGGVNAFGSAALALPALMLIDVWQWTPFVVLVLHAGMLSIPQEHFEAAAVDGASTVRVLRSVVLPAVVPQILLVLLFRTMDTYRVFDTVFVLTRGGPGDATETIGLYTYKAGFSFFEMGYAMALSIFILVTVAIICGAYLRLLRRRDAL